MRIVLLLVMFFFVTNLWSQANVNHWATLKMVTFEKKFDETMGYEIEIPKVGFLAKALDGKEITIEGFIIPVHGKIKQSHFMLSYFPANMCFFCGAAGPETAMQVFMEDGKNVAYSNDKIRLKGILRINEKDINSLIYTLENAKIL